jgi:hypothetical protein
MSASPAKKAAHPPNRPQRDAAAACCGLERLLDELVCDRADQHAGAERHHEPERLAPDLESHGEQAP